MKVNRRDNMSLVFRNVFLLLFLLLEVLFTSSATLTLDERQRGVAARVEGPRRVPSADGVPDPPGDLTVDPQSDTMVMLVWQDPDDTTDVDHYFAYVEEEAMEETTDLNYCFFDNLEACTEYTFGVMSVSAEGIMSDPILAEGRTLAAAPPAPQNLQVDDYTSSTVSLSWEKPDTQCDIEEYRVRWTKDGVNTQFTMTNETTFTVTGLSINTTYTFTVTGFTSFAEGDEANVQETTAVFDGGPPEDLRAIGVSTSAINVSWSPPAYEPLYYKVIAPPCVYLEEVVSGLSYLITGLKPCVGCSIFVTSYYNDTYQYQKDTSGSSQGGEPPPPKSCSVAVMEGAITVEWERPDSKCQLGINSVHWTATKLWGDEEEVSDSMNTHGQKINVLNPVPYSQYAFDISASIEGVFGSPASCIGTSLETLPGPPVIEAVDSVQGKAMVTWETPVEENGYILNYGIFVDGETEPRETVSGEVHSASLTLEPCKTFGLSVKAENGAGWGTPSEVKNVTVVDDDPVPPENCSVQVEGSALTVSWERPDTTCTLEAYRVDWTNTKLWGNGEEKSDSKNTTATNISVMDPVPYCEYLFNVSSSINGVFGKQSASCSGTSLEALPGPPVILSVDPGQGEAVVTWETPVEENGLIVNYGIYVDEATDPQVTVPGDVHNTSLGLEPCKTVGLSVKAKNGAGWGSPSEVKNVTAVGDDPVPPENCSVQVEESALTVSWERPDTWCLEVYRVDWTNTKLWGNGEEKSGSKNTTATNISVMDPVPYCEYLFNVSSSINGVFGKQSASCSGTSLEAPASPPTELVQVAMNVSSVTVQWSLPESLRGRLLGWYLNWTSAIGHYLGEQYITNPEERMLQIGDLDPSEVYNVYAMAVNGAGKGELAMLEASTEYVP